MIFLTFSNEKDFLQEAEIRASYLCHLFILELDKCKASGSSCLLTSTQPKGDVTANIKLPKHTRSTL
jgi:hypothetical protein